MDRRLPAAALSLLLLLSCGDGQREDVSGTQLFLPSAQGAVPVVVLVPGGAWTLADPSGLVPLARALADGGVLAATTTYRTASDGVVFPAPVEDVVCAAAEVVDRAVGQGMGGGPLVLVGHSAGAQLAVVAALRGPELVTRCRVELDGVVGLAGAYDVTALPELATALFGVPPEEDPVLWASGDPLEAASERPDVPALLLHGGADGVVPESMSERLADALRRGGHRVELGLVPGEDHDSVYSPRVAAERLLTWVRALRDAEPTPVPVGSG